MKLELNESEQSQIREVVESLAARYGSAEDPDFLRNAAVHAHELPLRVRQFLNDFYLFEPTSALCRIGGYPIDDGAVGPTPAHWKDRQNGSAPVEEEIYLVLLGSLLGAPIAWSTQQDGALVHDIAPVASHENEQLGSGSKEELTWHTEDAFHPCRGDYLGMMCMRNPEGVPTTFAALDISELDQRSVELLSQPLFTIRPDKSHLRKNRVDPVDDAVVDASHDRIDEMDTKPEKVAVLFGSLDGPYCRLDPYFMDPVEDPEAQQALDRLIEIIDRRLEDMVMSPGEVCFIDNFKAVHGRRAFKARYDGTDRWLKRINITRDLRRSRSVRPSADSRVIL